MRAFVGRGITITVARNETVPFSPEVCVCLVKPKRVSLFLAGI